MIYRTKLISKEKLTTRCWKFEFEKPKGFSFLAGQCADFTLLNPKYVDDRGGTRSFTLACAPSEKDLSIAVKVSDSGFKKSLVDLAVGGEIEVVGPFGSFTSHNDCKRPAVFVAGGIGITPFISILRDNVNKLGDMETFMFYSSKNLQEQIFLDELTVLAKNYDSFHFYPQVTESVPDNWQYKVGRIDARDILKLVSLDHHPVFYISGPIAFVNDIRDQLVALDVKDDDIRTDEFPGY